MPTPKESRETTHSEALEAQFLRDLDEEQRKRFTPTELIMYRHAQDFRYIALYTSISRYILAYTVIYVCSDRWRDIELKMTIPMLRRPEFDSNELDPDLHKRMQQAVEDGRIKCFNLLEGPADGDQDLNLWTRELEDVVREIVEDHVFMGNQNFSFKWTWMLQVSGCLAVRPMRVWPSRLDN